MAFCLCAHPGPCLLHVELVVCLSVVLWPTSEEHFVLEKHKLPRSVIAQLAWRYPGVYPQDHNKRPCFPQGKYRALFGT